MNKYIYLITNSWIFVWFLIQGFLETLNPLNTWGVDKENLFDDIMYEKSLKIQPKQSDSFCTVSSLFKLTVRLKTRITHM